jgi:hypothetical protein
MSSQAFRKLILTEIKIISGESPAPSKLNGIFALYNGAFSKIEAYLGNGQDYQISNMPDKKLIGNITSLVGSSSKLYKAINSLDTLQNICDKYSVTSIQTFSASGAKGSQITVSATGMSYTTGTTTNSLNILGTAYIPADAKIGQYISFLYSGSGIVTAAGASQQSWTLSNTASRTISSALLTVNVELITLVSANSSLKIYSMSITDNAFTLTYNSGPCLPLDNNKWWFVRVPCKYAVAASGCTGRTVNDYCIANTYDYTSGLPACTGVPGFSYVAQPTGSLSLARTLQSPLLTVDLPHAVRYRPYAPCNTGAGLVEPNKIFVYDNGNIDDAIQVNQLITATQRPDIYWITSNMVTGGDNQYMVIGGDYSITESLQSIIKGSYKKEVTSNKSVYSAN